MNYAQKHLTNINFMNTNTQIHIEYLGEYVSKSLMLELAVLNKREIGRREFSGGEGTH